MMHLRANNVLQVEAAVNRDPIVIRHDRYNNSLESKVAGLALRDHDWAYGTFGQNFPQPPYPNWTPWLAPTEAQADELSHLSET